MRLLAILFGLPLWLGAVVFVAVLVIVLAAVDLACKD
jgi:uncharacterized membrane protein YkvI